MDTKQKRTAETEVELLLCGVIPASDFAGKAFAVGGYVRDQFMGLDAKDLDIVVEEKGGAQRLAQYLFDMFGEDRVTHPHQTGEGYPIWQITFKEAIDYEGWLYETAGATVEFADTMKESFPDPTTRQRQTEFGTLAEDVCRRDFTVNMLMKDLTTGEVVDPTGVSKEDIRNCLLRGHPMVDFGVILRQDPLRMMRLVRFYCKYEWRIADEAYKVAQDNAERIQIVSAERIRGELEKIMECGKTAHAIIVMHELGLLKYVLPEVEALIGVEQQPEHHAEGDCFEHTCRVLFHAKPGVLPQVTALLHDVGKPRTAGVKEDGRITFYGHDKASAEMAEAIMRRLKFDLETIRKVSTLIRFHMRPFMMKSKWTMASVRKLIRDVGVDLMPELIALAHADALGRIPSDDERAVVLEKEVALALAGPVQISKKAVLTGDEVMEVLGIKPGPQVGKVLAFLIDVEDFMAERGKVMTKEVAKAMVRLEFT